MMIDTEDLTWIANTPDPKRFHVPTHVANWLEDKIIADPQVPPGSDLTIANLRELGYVGVYRREGTADQKALDPPA